MNVLCSKRYEGMTRRTGMIRCRSSRKIVSTCAIESCNDVASFFSGGSIGREDGHLSLAELRHGRVGAASAIPSWSTHDWGGEITPQNTTGRVLTLSCLKSVDSSGPFSARVTQRAMNQ